MLPPFPPAITGIPAHDDRRRWRRIADKSLTLPFSDPRREGPSLRNVSYMMSIDWGRRGGGEGYRFQLREGFICKEVLSRGVSRVHGFTGYAHFCPKHTHTRSDCYTVTRKRSVLQNEDTGHLSERIWLLSRRDRHTNPVDFAKKKA